MTDDQAHMDCGEWMAALSAEADGEDPGIDERLLAAHLAGCPACRRFRDDVAGLRRATAVTTAPDMPDLSHGVTKANAVADRASRWWVVRMLLALVAGVILLVSVPALLGGGDVAAGVHESRHVGAFSVAYAVALLIVVVRPARAAAILPVTMVLAGALLITAVVDVVTGETPFGGELVHLPELASVLLVWLLAKPVPEPAPAGAGGSGSSALRLLGRDDDEEERDAG